MKVHTIVLTSHSGQPYQNGMPLHFSAVNSIENTTNSNGGAADAQDIQQMKGPEVLNNENSTSIEEDFNQCAKEKRLSNPAYKLLSGRETLMSPGESSAKRDTNNLNNRLKDQSSENKDAYVIPDTALEREEIMRSFYDFDRDPIFIPDEVKNRRYTKASEDNPTPSKKQKVSDASETCETEGPSSKTKENTDLEAMLGTFVNKFVDE